MRSPSPGAAAIPRDQAAVLPLQRRFQPPLHVEEDLPQLRVLRHRLEEQVVVDAVDHELSKRHMVTPKDSGSGPSTTGKTKVKVEVS